MATARVSVSVETLTGWRSSLGEIHLARCLPGWIIDLIKYLYLTFSITISIISGITDRTHNGGKMEFSKVQENLYRRKAARLGLMLKKSHGKLWNVNNQLGYRIIDSEKGEILTGNRYDLSFSEAFAFIDDYEKSLLAEQKK
jgi:hypothetical protein